ncbi:hypothetical protein BVC80_1065g152 [Macleaya cordata]|uniref:Uncharacterized protein n=1 Tax=Macleaya cordata TaxID=56857 RepID=A0A200RD02_MACCD|nr:hypothetical protein BVC80_1065g152 [Macleaya cordata]
MKKKAELEAEDHELEIHKAVAQAWHGRSGNTNPTKEFDAYRSNYKNRPTRFKFEAMNKSLKEDVTGTNWDFGQSLWDSYEIVTLSKRLETGLLLDQQMHGSEDSRRTSKRRRESKNSLRNLIHRMSSKRFDDSNIPQEDDPQF